MWMKPKFLKDMYTPLIQLDSKQVDYTSEHKYQGYYVTDHMKDDKDIDRQIRQPYTKGNNLVSKFKSCTEKVTAELFRIYL